MDIKQAKKVRAREDAGTVVHIKDERGAKMFADDDPKRPVTVTVVGSYSDRAKRAQEASRDEMFKRRFAVDSDEATAMNHAVLIACILAWDGFTADGAPFPLSDENALALFEAAPWVREQIEQAHNNHAAFFKGS